MTSRAELQGVVGRKTKPDHHMLSVYLDVQQSQAARLARGFEPALRAMLRTAEQRVRAGPERKAFAASVNRVPRFLGDYTPGAPSLVVFCDATESFFWSREFRVPLRNTAHWAAAPYGRPLLELMDEHERYRVALSDRARARFFTVWLGEIAEHAETAATDPVQRSRKVGSDQMRSQAGAQRRAEHHAHWHPRHVAEMSDAIINTRAFDRLMLAGPI